MAEYKKSGGFKGNNQRRDFGRSSSDNPRFGGGKGGFRGGRGRDGGRPRMFSATCSECNRACEIPFRPTGERPVFCKDCFDNKRGSSQSNYSQRGAPPHNFPQRDFTPPPALTLRAEDKRIDELKLELHAVNKKLDTMMEMIKSMSTKKVAVKKSGASKK